MVPPEVSNHLIHVKRGCIRKGGVPLRHVRMRRRADAQCAFSRWGCRYESGVLFHLAVGKAAAGGTYRPANRMRSTSICASRSMRLSMAARPKRWRWERVGC